VREWSVGLRWCALLHAGVRGGADDTAAIGASVCVARAASVGVALSITTGSCIATAIAASVGVALSITTGSCIAIAIAPAVAVARSSSVVFACAIAACGGERWRWMLFAVRQRSWQLPWVLW
jgi:hypothetical protein